MIAGSWAWTNSIAAGALSIRVAVQFADTDLDAEGQRDVAEWAVAHCPVTESLTRSVPLDIELPA